MTTSAPTVKVPHLVLGLIFLGLAASWLLVETEVLRVQQLPYLLPVVLIASGLLGLLAVALGARGRRGARGMMASSETVEPQAPEDDRTRFAPDEEHTAPLSPPPPIQPTTPMNRIQEDDR